MRTIRDNKETQTGAAVEGAESHRLAHDGSPSSAAAPVCVDDGVPFEGWRHVRKVRARETARERRERLQLEREAAENFNHDPLGVLRHG